MNKFILVASDVHRDSEAFERLSAIARTRECLAFLYAGDLDVEDWFISDILRKRNFVFIPVAGNCDRPFSFTDAGLTPPPEYRSTDIGNLKIFMTHGHRYTLPEDVDLCSDKFDVVITGHTHKPNLTVRDTTIYMNPGSASLPRGGSRAGYGIIEILEDSILAQIRVLDGKETVSSVSVSLHK